MSSGDSEKCCILCYNELNNDDSLISSGDSGKCSILCYNEDSLMSNGDSGKCCILCYNEFCTYYRFRFGSIHSTITEVFNIEHAHTLR
jgi:hypothetical protein